MQKIKTFLHVLKHSLYPIDSFYVKVRKNTPLTYSLKYLVFLVFTLSVILAFIYPLKFIPLYQPDKLRVYVDEVFGQFPEEAAIVVNDNGILTTNHNRPLIIFSPVNTPEKLLVVDPQASNEMIEEYDSFILLMRSKAVVRTVEGSLTFKYDEYQPFNVNKNTVQNIKAIANTLLDYYWVFLIGLLLASIIVIPLFFTISKLVFIGITSFIVYVLAKAFFIKKLTYIKSYQIGLHASTGPIILEYLSIIFNLYIPIKLWFFILTLVFTSGALYEAYLEKSHNKS